MKRKMDFVARRSEQTINTKKVTTTTTTTNAIDFNGESRLCASLVDSSVSILNAELELGSKSLRVAAQTFTLLLFGLKLFC